MAPTRLANKRMGKQIDNAWAAGQREMGAGKVASILWTVNGGCTACKTNRGRTQCYFLSLIVRLILFESAMWQVYMCWWCTCVYHPSVCAGRVWTERLLRSRWLVQLAESDQSAWGSKSVCQLNSNRNLPIVASNNINVHKYQITEMSDVLLLHSRSSSFSHVSGSLDKLAQRHKSSYWSNKPLNFQRSRGGGFVPQCGSPILEKNSIPHCPTFPCTNTRVYNQRDTLATTTGVSGYATILIWFINTHGYEHKNTQLHTQNQVSMCRQGNQSLFALREGVVTVCVYVCLMGSN